ncbi:hypothetical protein SO802_025197 [Lithocarpus litseifolius]|uniref:RNase H type-1 domain-containing protein n=1 Tax=Lithocarpus litseifolius TaxID=425828 RepID=A0AAW2BYJ5_9ROSI
MGIMLIMGLQNLVKIYKTIYVYHEGSVGIGVVIRDHEGSVIAAMSKHLQLPLGPLEAEAKAMDEAVLFAWDMGVGDVTFEGDSCIVSHALSGLASPPSTVPNIISNTHHKLQEFRSLQITHVKVKR